MALGGALWLAGCTTAPPPASPAAQTPSTEAAPSPQPPSPEPPPQADPSVPPPGTITRNRSRWVPASFAELPGWGQDKLSQWWPALRLGCANPPPAWVVLCSEVKSQPAPAGDAAIQQWLEARMRVFRVESPTGDPQGLMTGYFEPLIHASRRPRPGWQVPLYQVPSNLGSRKPYWTRQQLDTLPEARAALRGREIAWIEDPLDALVLHIQGSGRMWVTEADGSQHLKRLAFAAHNDQPYRSVGRWLIEQGELKLSEASWPGIKDWARRNPRRVQEMLWQNPRYVFFREEALPDPAQGPRGAQSVPLTPGRSIAVDPHSIPYGSIVWLDSTEPLSPRPLQRLVMAQDTGSAITGAVRADFFWGWGEEAEANAGRTRQPLRQWVLWPR